jgi:phosphatidylserine/phosphatidylglycerophosphate/cardiolipin synthase-like enzyme
MKFLDAKSATAQIRKHVAKSTTIRMAVAFWGEGAVQQLGLSKTGAARKVICNLKMGGTNPKAIYALRKAGIEVSQCDTLHAKLYLFDQTVIIGSSNASANGLSLQGKQIEGWHEANVISDDPSVYSDASTWLDNLSTTSITDDDLKVAQELWTQRRRLAPYQTLSKKITLFEAVKRNPEEFRDQRIFLKISETFDPDLVKGYNEQEKSFKKRSTV